MKKQRTLRIILPAFAILGRLAVSDHDRKPARPPEPTVTVTGAIASTGDPAKIIVTLCDSSLLECTYPDDLTHGPEFISNPDYPPSLRVVFNPPNTTKILKYHYCAHESHVGSGELICENPDEHDPDYYFCLEIGGGISQKRKGSNFDHVVFPVDSPWKISWKKDNSIVAEGTLSIETTYDVTR